MREGYPTAVIPPPAHRWLEDCARVPQANYILALKGNQGTQNEDGRLYVEEQKAYNVKAAIITRHYTLDRDH